MIKAYAMKSHMTGKKVYGCVKGSEWGFRISGEAGKPLQTGLE